jgi:hypothetical protein
MSLAWSYSTIMAKPFCAGKDFAEYHPVRGYRMPCIHGLFFRVTGLTYKRLKHMVIDVDFVRGEDRLGAAFKVLSGFAESLCCPLPRSILPSTSRWALRSTNVRYPSQSSLRCFVLGSLSEKSRFAHRYPLGMLFLCLFNS